MLEETQLFVETLMKENVKQFAIKKKSGFAELKKNLKMQNVYILNTFERQRLNLP